MPVILMPSELDIYLNDDDAANEIIRRVPPDLVHSA